MHKHIHTYIHTHIGSYKNTYMYAYIYTHIHTYLHTYIHACIHTYIHMYIRTHTHTHTYIYIYIFNSSDYRIYWKENSVYCLCSKQKAYVYAVYCMYCPTSNARAGCYRSTRHSLLSAHRTHRAISSVHIMTAASARILLIS